MNIITSAINYYTSHQAAITAEIATTVLVYNTLAKAVQDGIAANSDKKGLEKIMAVTFSVLSYIFAGKRS